MTRAVLSAAIDSEWKSVSHGCPCPVCGADDTCSVHTVDDFASCAREPSDWKLTNGSWLHRVRGSSRVTPISGVVAASNNPAANGNGDRF